MKTIKEEKYLAVAKKIKDADNKLTTEYYYKTKLERSTTEMLDLYNPIFFKYNQHLMEEGKPISLILMTDEDRSIWGLGYRIGDDQYKALQPEDVSEDMLDEMLAVKDVGEVVQARMTQKSMNYSYEDYKAKKHKEIAKEKERKRNNVNFVLSLIALGISITILIIKICRFS